MSMGDFFERLAEARTFEEASDLGVFARGREVTAEELMKLTNEEAFLNTDVERGITWGTVNSNGTKGIVYCRHATGLADKSHRKHGGDDFTIT